MLVSEEVYFTHSGEFQFCHRCGMNMVGNQGDLVCLKCQTGDQEGTLTLHNKLTLLRSEMTILRSKYTSKDMWLKIRHEELITKGYKLS